MKKKFYYLLIILGVCGVLDTLYVFSLLGSINTGIILPFILGIPLIAYGYYKLKNNGPVIKNRTFKAIIQLGIIFTLILFIIIEGLIVYSAVDTYKPEDDAEFIIVLGCGVFPDGRLTLTLKNRLDKCLEYLSVNEDLKVIVSGGQGYNEPLPEGVAMKNYLVEMGVDENKILVEEKSTSTLENMKYSKALIEENIENTSFKAAIITSDFHMFRSKLIARRNGFEPFAIPCETPNFVKVNCYLREFLAVIKSVIFDV